RRTLAVRWLERPGVPFEPVRRQPGRANQEEPHVLLPRLRSTPAATALNHNRVCAECRVSDQRGGDLARSQTLSRFLAPRPDASRFPDRPMDYRRAGLPARG